MVFEPSVAACTELGVGVGVGVNINSSENAFVAVGAGNDGISNSSSF